MTLTYNGAPEGQREKLLIEYIGSIVRDLGDQLSENDFRGMVQDANRMNTPPLTDSELEREIYPAIPRFLARYTPHDKPMAASGDYSLYWDDDTVRPIEKPRTTPQTIPGQPAAQTIAFLKALFSPDDTVVIQPKAKHIEDKNKWVPFGKELPPRTCREWVNLIEDCNGDLTKVYTTALNPAAGAWLRINPMAADAPVDSSGNRKSFTDKDVADYRYVLVECDDIPVDDQRRKYDELGLPVAALVNSGGKSLHAVCRIDASDRAEYDKRVKELFDYCLENGLPIDTANKNPSRLMRLPGVQRGERWQTLESLGNGKSFEEWERVAMLPSSEEACELDPLAVPAFINYVDGVLTQGFYILNGAAKVGKSRLALQLCMSIARGDMFLGLPTLKSEVLFLAFEDEQIDIENRLKCYKHIPRGFHYLYRGRFKDYATPTIGNGLEELIDRELAAHPGIKVVYAESFKDLRPLEHLGSKNFVAAEKVDVDALMGICRRHPDLCLIVAHHIGKSGLRSGEGHKNAIGAGAGSYMVSGQAIGEWSMFKETDDTVSLCFGGRRIKGDRLILRSNHPFWELVGKADILDAGEKEDAEAALFDLCVYAVQHPELSGKKYLGKSADGWKGTIKDLKAVAASCDDLVDVPDLTRKSFTTELIVRLDMENIVYRCHRNGNAPPWHELKKANPDKDVSEWLKQNT